MSAPPPSAPPGPDGTGSAAGCAASNVDADVIEHVNTQRMPVSVRIRGPEEEEEEEEEEDRRELHILSEDGRPRSQSASSSRSPSQSGPRSRSRSSPRSRARSLSQSLSRSSSVWTLAWDEAATVLNRLPASLVACVVAWLPLKDLLRCCAVSSEWREIIVGNPEVSALSLVPLQEGVDDARLRQVLAMFPCIEELDLSGCFMLSDASLECVAEFCEHLRRLNISRCRQLSDAGLLALKQCVQLEVLILWGCRCITTEALEELESHLQKLCTPLV